MIIRPLVTTDREALKRFFLSLSDETVFLNNRWNSREGNANTEVGAECASLLACSPVTDFPEAERGYIVIEQIDPQKPLPVLEPDNSGLGHIISKPYIFGYGWLRFSFKPTQKFTCSLGIIVLDAYQGKGIGKQLMNHMIGEAKRLGMKKVWLNVYWHNHKAVSLYEKLGFVTEGVFLKQEWDGDKPLDVMSMGLFL